MSLGHRLKTANLQPLNPAYLERNASVEYLMDNNIFLRVLSQSTFQPLLYEPQYAAEEFFSQGRREP